MNKLSTVLFLVILSSCQVKVSVKGPYAEYFDQSTFKILQNGMHAYSAKQYLLADSLLTVVISKCRNNLPITMPREANPYFYRGNNDIEIGKYEQALTDMDHVAADTTTEPEVILVRCEALKALKKYDACIELCNRLIILRYDSIASLSERGECYFYKGEFDKACADLLYCKKHSGANSEFIAFLDRLLKNCNCKLN